MLDSQEGKKCVWGGVSCSPHPTDTKTQVSQQGEYMESEENKPDRSHWQVAKGTQMRSVMWRPKQRRDSS